MRMSQGHVGDTGRELCDKRSRAQFTLADELQPCVHEAQAHTQRESRKEGPHSLCQEKHGGSSPSCRKCAKGHLSDCLPGFCWPHRKSGLQRVLLLRSPKADRYKCPRSKSTNVQGVNQQETEKRGKVHLIGRCH